MDQRKPGVPMIRFRCQHCGRRYGAPETYVGRTIACKACGKAMVVTEDVSDWLAAVTAETQSYEAWAAEHPDEPAKADAAAQGPAAAAPNATTPAPPTAIPTAAPAVAANAAAPASAEPAQRPKPRPMPRRPVAPAEAAALWKGDPPAEAPASPHDSHWHGHDGHWEQAGGIPSPAIAPGNRPEAPAVAPGAATTITAVAEPVTAAVPAVAPATPSILPAPAAIPTAAPAVAAPAPSPTAAVVPSPTHASPEDGVRAYRRVSSLTLLQDVTVTLLSLGFVAYLALQHVDAAWKWHTPEAPQRWIELGIAGGAVLLLVFNLVASRKIARTVRKQLVPPTK